MPAAFPALFKSSSTGTCSASRSPGSAAGGCTCRAGAMLGGCCSINAMIYIRGNRADYDGWAARGCEGWGYEEVLPYFRRSEDNERGEDAFHGAGGPMRCPTAARCTRSSTRCSRPRARPGTSTTRTSTARARRASGASS